MQVVRVFFTILLICFVVWLVVDTIRLFVRKYKERKEKKQKKNDEVKQEVIEPKEDNDKN